MLRNLNPTLASSPSLRPFFVKMVARLDIPAYFGTRRVPGCTYRVSVFTPA